MESRQGSGAPSWGTLGGPGQVCEQEPVISGSSNMDLQGWLNTGSWVRLMAVNIDDKLPRRL